MTLVLVSQRVCRDGCTAKEDLMKQPRTKLWVQRGVQKMPEVTFMSRSVASRFEPVGNAVLVAIRNPRNHALELEGWADVLHLEFHDIDERYEDFQLFTFGQAFQVCDFIRKHSECDLIAAQCDYGISRSGAVAIFASRLIGSKSLDGTDGFNRFVYRRLVAAHMLDCLKKLKLIKAVRDFQRLRMR